jgi:predicted nucleic acid-binding protein
MYVLDTSYSFQASRSSHFRGLLRTFLVHMGPRVLLSTVVLHALLVGASTIESQEEIVREVARPLQRHAPIIDTDDVVWPDAALITRTIGALGGLAVKVKSANFRHDVLIAASCRQVGATLITNNSKGFETISSVRQFRFMRVFPLLLICTITMSAR